MDGRLGAGSGYETNDENRSGKGVELGVRSPCCRRVMISEPMEQGEVGMMGEMVRAYGASEAALKGHCKHGTSLFPQLGLVACTWFESTFPMGTVLFNSISLFCI